MSVRAARQSGFTYLGLLFAVAILGITLATIGVVWSTQIRRDKEAELLFVGDQYRLAISRYLRGGSYPLALGDLLEDKRTPVPRRYLRRLYPDPMTGVADWQLITVAGGGIVGVASSSQNKPIKVSGFLPADADFENAVCYCDWRFVFQARRRGLNGAAPMPLAAPAQNLGTVAPGMLAPPGGT
jgi:type II secretory pathway pseudopilin PulG